MKIKIILLVLLITVSSHNVYAKSDAQDITLEFHQNWYFLNENDALVTETISSNEDLDIPSGIGLAQNIEVADYSAYLDDPNSLPVNTSYRPKKDENGIHVPNFRLLNNRTLIRKFTFLQVTNPVNFSFFNLTTFYFPFDKYNFLLVIPMMNYSQNYSADIIFPASFEIENPNIYHPCITDQKNIDGFIFTVAGHCTPIPDILISKSIEEYKYTAYVPKMYIPNSSQSKYFPKNPWAEINFIYGRPSLFKLIFIISSIFMVLVTFLSPLTDKEKMKNYLLSIGGIWATQEGVSFLQGHRPLELTLYDLTILPFIFIIIIVCLLQYRKRYNSNINSP